MVGNSPSRECVVFCQQTRHWGAHIYSVLLVACLHCFAMNLLKLRLAHSHTRDGVVYEYIGQGIAQSANSLTQMSATRGYTKAT